MVSRCADCGTPRQTCEATRDMERRACCDWCEHDEPSPGPM